MFLTFIWQSRNLAPSIARDKLAHVLEAERERYSDAIASSPELDVTCVGNVHVGQLRYDPGIEDWYPWISGQDLSVIWGGVCETFLGNKFDMARIEDLAKEITHQPEVLASWDGRYCVILLDHRKGRAILATGATESPSLWFADGPNGWAIGSRAGPILELVGRRKSLNKASAALFFGFGQLIGNGSLFDGVSRISSRTRVTFDGISEPQLDTYTSLSDYLFKDNVPTLVDDLVDGFAARLHERVETQLQYSRDATLFLTGGRDSRCIAAAAKGNGFKGLAYCAGEKSSADVRIANNVATHLGLRFEHELHANINNRVQTMARPPRALKEWSQLSEGIETVRQAVNKERFFTRTLPIRNARPLAFHGLGGEICRGFFYSKQSIPHEILNGNDLTPVIEILMKKCGGLSESADDAIRKELSRTIARFNTEIDWGCSLADWLDLFYWQNKCLHWGEDLVSAKSPFSWYWTPLLDRYLIQSSCRLTATDKVSGRFLENVTLRLAPSLKCVGYNNATQAGAHSVTGYRNTIRSAVRELIPDVLLTSARRARSQWTDPELLDFWNLVLFDSGPGVWRDCIDERAMRSLMYGNPKSTTLWNIATVELFASAHCS